MDNDINILILSCGTRNKIIQYFKNELAGRGRVIAADCSELAPALYEADTYVITPRIDEDGYLDSIIKICKEYKVKGVLSLIDPELSLIAKNRQIFLEIGVVPIVSEYEVLEMSFNKYKMYEFLCNNGFPTAKSYISKERFYEDVEMEVVRYPVFVKPVKGSASLNINKATCQEEIELLFCKYDNLMIQEYIDGKEYGADVYIDLISHETVALFVKEKIKMRAGETDKSVSVWDEELIDLIKKFVIKAGFTGVIDIDLFKSNGKYYISEVNPRFGGGYPHAYECGVNIPKMIINNIAGISNENVTRLYDTGLYMMKYLDVKILKL